MTTQEQRNRLAALRSKHRDTGQAITASGMRVEWQDLAGQVVVGRRQVQDAEREVVRAARGAGVSWDRISAALDCQPSGEQLRRRYG